MKPLSSPTVLTALSVKLRDTWLLRQFQHIKRQIFRRSEGEAFLMRRYARIHGTALKNMCGAANRS